jgi:hypothetical protein
MSWLLKILLAALMLVAVVLTTFYTFVHGRDGEFRSRQPPAAPGDVIKLSTLPPMQERGMGLDLRHRDVRDVDLRQAGPERLNRIAFDGATVWPAAEKMPPGLKPQEYLELGRNPGLGVRRLHERGVTGRGVGIAIIDMPLLVDHVEYADRVRLYEELEPVSRVEGGVAGMHGCAVASIAVGRTCGVAPEADLYFIAASCAKLDYIGVLMGQRDFQWYAQAVRRVLEINAGLPADRKIRVISMSVGWEPWEAGYAEIVAAVHAAQDAGLLVVSSSSGDDGFFFHGLGRRPLSSPDDWESYLPGSWWRGGLAGSNAKSVLEYMQQMRLGRLEPDSLILVPMDGRTAAAPTGPEDYVFYGQGGWSWSIPYIAGLYALAAQVKPEVTPTEFWHAAARTGRTIGWQSPRGAIELGPIVDAERLIAELSPTRHAKE